MRMENKKQCQLGFRRIIGKRVRYPYRTVYNALNWHWNILLVHN